jgi:hypothetical protein
LISLATFKGEEAEIREGSADVEKEIDKSLNKDGIFERLSCKSRRVIEMLRASKFRQTTDRKTQKNTTAPSPAFLQFRRMIKES